MSVQQWKDAEGNEWNLSLTFKAVRKIQQVVGVDLLDESMAVNVIALQSQRLKLAEVLWLLTKEQADLRGVTQDDFYDALDADALEAGFSAIYEAFVLFCPSPRREAVRAALV